MLRYESMYQSLSLPVYSVAMTESVSASGRWRRVESKAKQAIKQASKQSSRQASNQAGRQAIKQAGKQASHDEI